MPARYRLLLQSLVPFWGDTDEHTTALRSLRMALVFVGVLNPIFWAVYQQTLPGAFDPLWVRLLQCGGAAVLLGLTYLPGTVRRNPRRTLAVVIHALLLWYGYLTAVNDLAADFAFGYQFVVLAAAMVYSLAWTSMAPMAVMLVVSGVIALGISGWVGDAGVSREMFLLVLFGGSAVVFLTFSARLRAVSALVQSEARLAEAEHLAGVGSWTLDLETGERTWSSGAHRVLGPMSHERGPFPLWDLLHPDDEDRARAVFKRLCQEGGVTDARIRLLHPEGQIQTIRCVSTATPDRRGVIRHLRGAFVDVTAQVAREEELEADAKAKTAFLANMSHEIRTPLTAIIGFAQMLREEVGEEHADLVEPIEAGGTRLLGTLNSVLDLARMEAGETDLDLVPTDIAQGAREVASLLRPQAAGKGLTLVVDGPAAGLTVLADPDALARVLTNLVSNAVKFTERGGVTIALRPTEGAVEVAVDDTGRGMDATFLTELFEPFRQASTGWARSHEGTGLGLTITRQLVHAMGGTISVESEVGVGTRFLVSLPAASAEAAAPTVSAPAVSALEPAVG